jgi:hypothetical protein
MRFILLHQSFAPGDDKPRSNGGLPALSVSIGASLTERFKTKLYGLDVSTVTVAKLESKQEEV